MCMRFVCTRIRISFDWALESGPRQRHNQSAESRVLGAFDEWMVYSGFVGSQFSISGVYAAHVVHEFSTPSCHLQLQLVG
jgi:hypothetical protein